MKRISFKGRGSKIWAAALLNVGLLLGTPTLGYAQFEGAIKGFVEGYAIPSYIHFADASAAEDTALKALCKAPSSEGLSQSRSAFRDLVRAWSAVEVIRFGPAKAANRFEKIFFWPDPRARGQKQVQKLLYQLSKEADLTLDNLQGKSVAVQGLPALEYLLFGKGAETLAAVGQSSARCLFAETVAANVAFHASAIAAEWQAAEGFQKILTDTGPDNPIYRNDKEALQEILKSVVEILEINGSSKLHGSLNDDISKIKPRNAPFWRSDLTIDSLKASLLSLMELQNAMNLQSLLKDEDRWAARQIDFEAQQVVKTYDLLMAKNLNWQKLLADPKGYELLKYSTIPLQGIEDEFSESYPEMLGLKLGFNSLDGD